MKRNLGILACIVIAIAAIAPKYAAEKPAERPTERPTDTCGVSD